jgi:hypothetical protein
VNAFRIGSVTVRVAIAAAERTAVAVGVARPGVSRREPTPAKHDGDERRSDHASHIQEKRYVNLAMFRVSSRMVVRGLPSDAPGDGASLGCAGTAGAAMLQLGCGAPRGLDKSGQKFDRQTGLIRAAEAAKSGRARLPVRDAGLFSMAVARTSYVTPDMRVSEECLNLFPYHRFSQTAESSAPPGGHSPGKADRHRYARFRHPARTHRIGIDAVARPSQATMAGRR